MTISSRPHTMTTLRMTFISTSGISLSFLHPTNKTQTKSMSPIRNATTSILQIFRTVWSNQLATVCDSLALVRNPTVKLSLVNVDLALTATMKILSPTTSLKSLKKTIEPLSLKVDLKVEIFARLLRSLTMNTIYS